MLSRDKSKKRSKKGVSIIIGYVLLMAFAVAIGTIVYTQLKKSVPTNSLECPDGIVLFIEDHGCQSSILNLTLKNKGTFSIGGYFIRASNDSEFKIPQIDLSTAIIHGGNNTFPGIRITGLNNNLNELGPGKSTVNSFNLSAVGLDKTYSVELVPFLWYVEDNLQKLVTCGDAKIKENIECT